MAAERCVTNEDRLSLNAPQHTSHELRQSENAPHKLKVTGKAARRGEWVAEFRAGSVVARSVLTRQAMGARLSMMSTLRPAAYELILQLTCRVAALRNPLKPLTRRS